jgi:hypothetical protein
MAFGISETNAPATQAFLEYPVLFLELLDHVQLTAVDPRSEYHEQQLKRLKWWEHCSAVYRLTTIVRHRAAGLRFLDRVAPISGHFGNGLAIGAAHARSAQRSRQN